MRILYRRSDTFMCARIFFVMLGKQLLTFRRRLLPSFSGPSSAYIQSARSNITPSNLSVTKYRSTWRNIMANLILDSTYFSINFPEKKAAVSRTRPYTPKFKKVWVYKFYVALIVLGTQNLIQFHK
jgi:hypothetical protein